MFAIGQVVYSKCGRDKGLVFVVVSADGEFVWLADGRLRRLEKPKKKKCKHVQPTKTLLPGVRDKLEKPAGAALLDADVRKALEPFKSALQKGNKGVNGLV